ncbi:hypothetical protein TrVFT333_000031 [Trichoderma virens FT-333]|nr:hypothetical protein TrVFT333_000031 [Trichoderma virens FT-333]
MANVDEKVDDAILEHNSSNGGNDVVLARQAAQVEHSLGFIQALRNYPKAVMWSVLLSTSIIMEGYDIISASWQNGLSNAVSIGTIVGAFANGYFTHKFGYRKVLLASLLLVVGFVFIPFFAPNLGVLLVGELLCGIPWGVFATMAPAYASEVCPMALRGYLTVYVNLCWAVGQLISAGIQAGFEKNATEWSYRIPFAIQWTWPIPLFFILWFAPESPWFYVRQGLFSDAERIIIRLGADRGMAKQVLAMMVHTNELEQSIDKGTSYLDCFCGIDRYRTEIACMAFAAQPFYVGRRAGARICGNHHLLVSNASSGKTAGAADSVGGNYAQASMVLLWQFVYYLTVGPICYAIIGEVSSTRLRNKSVCLSRITYYIAQIICNVVNPYMLNPTAGNWRGKTGFFWAFWAFIFFVWTWFRLPETKDKTFEELDILFARGIKAREFASYKVDAYIEGEEKVTKNA